MAKARKVPLALTDPPLPPGLAKAFDVTAERVAIGDRLYRAAAAEFAETHFRESLNGLGISRGISFIHSYSAMAAIFDGANIGQFMRLFQTARDTALLLKSQIFVSLLCHVASTEPDGTLPAPFRVWLSEALLALVDRSCPAILKEAQYYSTKGIYGGMLLAGSQPSEISSVVVGVGFKTKRREDPNGSNRLPGKRGCMELSTPSRVALWPETDNVATESTHDAVNPESLSASREPQHAAKDVAAFNSPGVALGLPENLSPSPHVGGGSLHGSSPSALTSLSPFAFDVLVSTASSSRPTDSNIVHPPGLCEHVDTAITSPVGNVAYGASGNGPAVIPSAQVAVSRLPSDANGTQAPTVTWPKSPAFAMPNRRLEFGCQTPRTNYHQQQTLHGYPRTARNYPSWKTYDPSYAEYPSSTSILPYSGSAYAPSGQRSVPCVYNSSSTITGVASCPQGLQPAPMCHQEQDIPAQPAYIAGPCHDLLHAGHCQGAACHHHPGAMMNRTALMYHAAATTSYSTPEGLQVLSAGVNCKRSASPMSAIKQKTCRYD